MSRRQLFDPEDLFNRGLLEPRELLKRKKELTAIDEHPESVLGMLVTSAAEVAVPGIPDLLLVIDDQL
jgi:hypothetical protein